MAVNFTVNQCLMLFKSTCSRPHSFQVPWTKVVNVHIWQHGCKPFQPIYIINDNWVFNVFNISPVLPRLSSLEYTLLFPWCNMHSLNFNLYHFTIKLKDITVRQCHSFLESNIFHWNAVYSMFLWAISILSSKNKLIKII